MKKIKKILAMSMATICSISSFNLVNAWGSVGITDRQLNRELPIRFNEIWETLRQGPDNEWDLPEEKIIDAAREGKIELNCVVRAKILKDILVEWDVLGTTLQIDDHLFVIALKTNGELLALNVYDKDRKGKSVQLLVQDIDLFIKSDYFSSIPIARDAVSRNYYGGISLGAWMRMESLKLYASIKKGNMDDLELKQKQNMHAGLQKKIMRDTKKGLIFVQPFIVIYGDDKFGRTLSLLLPLQLNYEQYENLIALNNNLDDIDYFWICSSSKYLNTQGKVKLKNIMESLNKILPGDLPVFIFKSKFLNSDNKVLWRKKYKGYNYWKEGQEKCPCVKAKIPLKCFKA